MVTGDMEKKLNQLIDRLQKAHGESLTSVILYGSAAAGDYDGKFSDLNILCVLKQVTPHELAASTPIVRWWHEQGNPAPLTLSDEEVRGSTDCFAIEFHDIRERHRVLYGEDVVRNLEIDDSFYRAQVEYELRAKLLRLRHKAAEALADSDLLRSLLTDSVSTFCVLFRHALRLVGAEAGFEKRVVIGQAQERFGISAAPFERLLDLREDKIKPREVDPVPLLAEYMKQIQVVIDAIDGLEK